MTRPPIAFTLLAAFLVSYAIAGATGSANAHSSGCHSAHTCPSDHHSYVWYDTSGAGWDCAKPDAAEYNPASDTTPISNDGYTYYCRNAGQAPAPPPSAPVSNDPSSSPTTPSPGAKICRLARLPDRRCTPGTTFRGPAKQVCVRGYSRKVRRVSTTTKNQVFARYGVKTHRPGQYEIDHLIALELGGNNDIRNLFPEAAAPKPGFHEKDKLENRLHSLVCTGRLSLSKAQRLIKRDWVAAYHRYVR
jgi:hypothetical protein